jgi:alkanesulfonate monooxygenase SsuD/methylene tetrahydromethanopterin reductase-like flavin-dependent oxidoreductase (luciferase family)
LKYSIMTEPQMGGTYEEILRAALLAEKEGLYSFARSDHLAWDRSPSPDATDAFATLAGLARETNTVRLCVLVTPITFRHPAIIAKNAATIDQMSGGRLDLGVGTGWNDFEHEALGIPFPGSAERWERLGDALDYLKEAFGDGTGHHDGPFYSLDLDVNPKPTGIKIIVGGSGPKRTPRLAGNKADEYNFFVCPPEEARDKIATMREAAAGRRVEATMMGPITIAGSDGELAERLMAAAGRRDITSDELISRWERAGVVFGTPSQVRDKIAAFEEAGVERIYLQWLDLSDHDGLVRTLELVRG